MIIKILNTSNNPTPKYETENSAGFDLRASEDIEIPGSQAVLVPTGLKTIIPAGYEGQIRLRSSMYKNQVVMPNAPGTIDSDYRGEIKIPLRNVLSDPTTIKKGDRIAQMLIKKTPKIELVEVSEEEFNKNITERGSGGFGSTGQK